MILRIIKYAAFLGLFILLAGLSAYLTLSLVIKSEDAVIVPDFVGKDVVYVLEVLTELGLNTKVQGSDYSETIPKNHIIDQTPRPGAEIKKGRDVKFIISKGPKSVLMPNIIGLSPPQARIIFEENDLCQGKLARIHDERIPSENVIAQVPESGRMVQRGQCVDLLVSLGSRPGASKMPDLDGLSLEDALLTIESSNLTNGQIATANQKKRPRNVILEQQPLQGHRVIVKSPVNLVVNRKNGIQNGDLLRSVGRGRLLRYQIPPGLLKRHIRVTIQSKGYSGEIFDDFVKPGQDVWLIIPVVQETIVLVHEDDKLTLTKVFED